VVLIKVTVLLLLLFYVLNSNTSPDPTGDSYEFNINYTSDIIENVTQPSYTITKIGVITFATGKPMKTVESKILSFQKHFCALRPDMSVHFLVFTDQMDASLPLNITPIEDGVKRKPWDSLLRYEMMANKIYGLGLHEYDYLFYSEVEAVAVVDFCEEILLPRVAVKHPYYRAVNWTELPYERRLESTAGVTEADFIRPIQYYDGSFYGGKAGQFISLISVLKYNVQLDIKHQIVAVGNAESHLNKYFLTYSPTVVITPTVVIPSFLNLNSKS